MRTLIELKNIPGYKPPLYYQCDGFSRKTYEYDRKTKTLKVTGTRREPCSKYWVIIIITTHYFIKPTLHHPARIINKMDVAP